MNRSSTLRASLVAACTMLLLSTSLADAAQIRQPQEPQIPITTPDPGNNNKPVVDFDEDIWTKLAEDPYANIACWMDGLESKHGIGVTMKNNTGKTIPKGSIIIWTFPGGMKVTMTVVADIKPGGWFGTDVPKWMKDMVGFWCTVKVDWIPARVK